MPQWPETAALPQATTRAGVRDMAASDRGPATTAMRAAGVRLEMPGPLIRAIGWFDRRPAR
jgi:hypothetical protein